MTENLIPLAVHYWEVNDVLPTRGVWHAKEFHNSNYVEAWEMFMRLKWEGKATYLLFHGEIQAQANINPELPEIRGEAA